MSEATDLSHLVEMLSDVSPEPDKTSTGLFRRMRERKERRCISLVRSLREALLDVGRTAMFTIKTKLTNLKDTTHGIHKRAHGYVTDSDFTAAIYGLTTESFDLAFHHLKESMSDSRTHIQKTFLEIKTIEHQRQKKFTAAFDKFVPQMISELQLLSTDISRTMEQEITTLNQVILRNSRVSIGLFRILLKENIQLDRQLHEILHLHLAEWKSFELTKALTAAKEGLDQLMNVSPEISERIRRESLRQFVDLRLTREEKLEKIRLLVPPAVSLVKCCEWRADVHECTQEMFDTLAEGIDRLCAELETAHYTFHEEILVTAEHLTATLQLSDSEVFEKFVDPLHQRLAENRHSFDIDAQFCHTEINKQRDKELGLLEDLFAVLQGATWQWELHLTGLAKAESHLEIFFEKQRQLISSYVDSKNTKLKGILESLRYSWTSSVTNTQLQTATTLFAELQHMVEDIQKKSNRLPSMAMTLFQILLRGYGDRLCSYFQVRAEPPLPALHEPIKTIVESTSVVTQTPHHSSSSHPSRAVAAHGHVHMKVLAPALDPDNLTSGSRCLPDVPMTAHERNNLQELLIKLAEEEDFGIRMKTLPATKDDSRLPPPAQPITFGAHTFVGQQSAATTHLRFFQEPPVPLSPDQSTLDGVPKLVIQMTNSQTDMMQDTVFHLPNRTGLINFDEVMTSLSASEISSSAVRRLRREIRDRFLQHLAEQWSSVLQHHSQCFIDSKAECYKAELLLQLRCSRDRVVFVATVAQVRAEELLEHESRHKQCENEVLHGITSLKAMFAGVNKKINEKLGFTKDILALIEKGFYNASRVSHMTRLKLSVKEESSQYLGYVKKIITDFRLHSTENCHRLQALLASATSSLKKVADDGTYANEECRHYEHLQLRLKEKLSVAEKHLNDECRLTEQRRKAVIDQVVTKILEKAPHHDQDIEIIHRLGELLGGAQTEIKREVAYINTSLTEVLTTYERLEETRKSLCEGKVQATFSAEHYLQLLFELLNQFRSILTRVGCLERSPRSVPSTNAAIPAISIPPYSEVIDTNIIGNVDDGGRRNQSRKSRANASPELPMDFCLRTIDGPLEPVLPRIFIPIEPKILLPSNKTLSSTVIDNSSGATKSRHSVPPRTSTISSGVLMAQKKKQKKMERFLVFGETSPQADSTFLDLVNRVCWRVLNDALSLAEEYYKVKGSRQITRPSLLPETFEHLAERICKKLLNYFSQSENFAEALSVKSIVISDGFVSLIKAISSELPNFHLARYKLESNTLLEMSKRDYGKICDRISDPDRSLDGINALKELFRENDTNKMLKRVTSDANLAYSACLGDLTHKFVTSFTDTVSSLFKACDLVIAPEEVYHFKSRLNEPTTMLADNNYSARTENTGRTWTALSFDNIAVSPDIKNQTVTTDRSSALHLSVDEARQAVYSEFMRIYSTLNCQISNEKSPWSKSVDTELNRFLELQLKRLLILSEIKNC